MRTFILFLLFAPPLLLAGSIQGVVRDATTLQPLPGIVVAVDVVNPDSTHLPDTTDATGAYQISGIAPGNQIYVLEGYFSQYASLYVRIPNLGSTDLVYDIALLPVSSLPPSGGDSTHVSGVVHALTNGGTTLGPVASATVTLASAGKETQTRTNQQGVYGATIPRGSYSVTVTATGYVDWHSTSIGIDEHGATVNAVLLSAATEAGKVMPPRPAVFALSPAYPDPFNPSTSIHYELPAAGMVDLGVYDILGRKVAALVNEWQKAGRHISSFRPAGLSSGMYLVRLQWSAADGARSKVSVRRVTYLR